MVKKKKDEAPVSPLLALIDTPVVAGYDVKEWSIRHFSQLYPYLKTVVVTLQERGATMGNIQEYLLDNQMALVDAVIPVLPEILELSLGLTKEQVDEIPVATAALLGVAILMKNMEHLTSFLAQVTGSVKDQDQIQPTT